MSDVVPATRFEWTYPMSPPPAHLVMDVGGLTFTRGDHVQRVGLAEFSGGALHDPIVDAFDFPTLVEALALALPSSKALLEGGVPSDPLHRPKVVRVHGGGRGAAWVVFLLGRTVSGRALGEPFVLSFDDLLARGLPSSVASVIGTETAAAVTHAVEQLAPLPCMCDTGCETQDQHGTTTSLLRRENPHAACEFHVSVAQCSVCQRLWSFQMVGDSHYSYQCSARPVVSVTRP